MFVSHIDIELQELNNQKEKLTNVIKQTDDTYLIFS